MKRYIRADSELKLDTELSWEIMRYISDNNIVEDAVEEAKQVVPGKGFKVRKRAADLVWDRVHEIYPELSEDTARRVDDYIWDTIDEYYNGPEWDG